MKKYLILLFFILFLPSVMAQEQTLPNVPDDKPIRKQFSLSGQWRPDDDPLKIGAEDFATLQNWRYTDAGLDAVRGYSKINTAALSTYLKGRSGIQLRTQYDVSHVIVQAYNTGLSASQVIENRTAIPDQGDFESTALHTDASGAGLGRFSKAPGGRIAYCNGKEAMTWAGEEDHNVAFIRIDSISGLVATNPVDYSEEIRNTLSTTGNTVTLSGSSLKALVGATRPLKGIKFYVSTANSTTSTLTAKYWSGSAWTAVSNPSDGTTSGGKALAQTGTLSFDSTVTTAKVGYIEKKIIYYYLIELSAGSATINHVTVDAPFQDIVDVWNNVLRICTQFQASRSSVYEDWTGEINYDSSLSGSSQYPIVAKIGGLLNSDHVILIFDDRITAVRWEMRAGYVNDTAATVTIYYWNGTAWTSVGTVTDGTLDSAGSTKSLNQSGVMSWQAPSEGSEFPQALFDIEGYAYKLVWSATLEDGTGHDGTSVDLVYGIPAQKTITGYKASMLYKNRLLLINSTDTKQGNRVDFCESNSPDVWNGDETSNGKFGPLYFGGGDDLICGIQILNRYGSRIIDPGILFKNTETYILRGNSPDSTDADPFIIQPVSSHIGCPAPLTLVTASTSYVVSEDAQRQSAFWISFNGPYGFDGSVIFPIPGIRKYFDPEKDTCINYAAIEKARSWIDPINHEWNVGLPCGSGQTTINTWIVYDLQRKKWYEKVPSTYPQHAFQVEDSDGAVYLYGFLDTGYMMRLEYGSSWDGTAITYALKTADQLPIGDSWFKTRIRRLKLISQMPDLDEGETVTIAIKHYIDGERDEYSTLDSFEIDPTDYLTAFFLVDDEGNYYVDHNGNKYVVYKIQTPRHVRKTQACNLLGWSHQFEFTMTSNDYGFINNFGKRLLGWGYTAYVEREDK